MTQSSQLAAFFRFAVCTAGVTLTPLRAALSTALGPQIRSFSSTSRRRVSRSITLKLVLSMKSTAPEVSASIDASAPSWV